MKQEPLRIYVLLALTEEQKQDFFKAAPEASFQFREQGGHVDRQALKTAHIIIGNPDPEDLKGSEHLKFLQLNSAGSDTYAAPGVLPAGTLLANATGAYGLAISEHMIGSLLMLYKHLHRYWDNQNQCLWKDEGPVKAIWDSNVLVVGLGDIGGSFAKLAHAFGAHVTGVRRSRAQKPDYVDRLCLADELDQALAGADVVALCLPRTKETEQLLDARRLALMKQGAVILNVGRGNAIDSMALCKELDSGHLGGACLDVTDPEPLPGGHPLWKAKNVLITPHISGGYHLPETYSRIVGIAVENVRRYASGEPLINQVDFSTGYRRSDQG